MRNARALADSASNGGIGSSQEGRTKGFMVVGSTSGADDVVLEERGLTLSRRWGCIASEKVARACRLPIVRHGVQGELEESTEVKVIVRVAVE